jgi:putative transposase
VQRDLGLDGPQQPHLGGDLGGQVIKRDSRVGTVELERRLSRGDPLLGALCAQMTARGLGDDRREPLRARESTESWADVLRDLRRRGMSAPMIAVGDGALGFWAALADVFGETRTQRCWVHKANNVLNALPTSAQPAARRAIAEIRDAEDRDHALAAIKSFERDYGAKWPKAVAKIVDDTEALLAFYDFPAEHWVHLKTSNPIESTFATVRLRTKVTKGPGSKAAGLAMAFKLIEAAQDRWRAVNAPHLVALVRAGVEFDKGVMIERTNQQDTEVAA